MKFEQIGAIVVIIVSAALLVFCTIMGISLGMLSLITPIDAANGRPSVLPWIYEKLPFAWQWAVVTLATIGAIAVVLGSYTCLRRAFVSAKSQKFGRENRSSSAEILLRREGHLTPSHFRSSTARMMHGERREQKR